MSAQYAKRFEAVFLCIHPKGPKMTAAAAGRYVGMSASFVKKWVQRYTESNNVDDLPERGTSRATTEEIDKEIVRLFEENTDLTLRKAKEILSEKGVTVSLNTIRRRLQEAKVIGLKLENLESGEDEEDDEYNSDNATNELPDHLNENGLSNDNVSNEIQNTTDKGFESNIESLSEDSQSNKGVVIKTEPQDHIEVSDDESSQDSRGNHSIGSVTESNKNYDANTNEEKNQKRYATRRSLVTYPRPCKECDLVLSNKEAYEAHQQSHVNRASTNHNEQSDGEVEEEEEDNTCDHCFQAFPNKSLLKRHLKTHSSSRYTNGTGKEKTFWCDICHKACQGYMLLQAHKQEHEIEEINEMKGIDLVNSSSTSKIKEEMRDNGYYERAGEEGEEYDDGTRPELGILSITDDVIYPCDMCEMEFTSMNDLNIHKHEHMAMEQDESDPELDLLHESNADSEEYNCKLCKRVFSSVTALRVHRGWHKRAKVNHKSKILKTEIMEDVHDTPPNFCDICQRGFINETALEVHMLEFHESIDASMMMLTCELCNVEFDSEAAFDKHNEYHKIIEQQEFLKKEELKQQYIKREELRKQYIKKEELKRKYIKKETQQNLGLKGKQFVCKQCHLICANAETLNQHCQTVHKKTVHKCPHCRGTFMRPQALSSHIRHTHKDIISKRKPMPVNKPSPGPSEGSIKCSICFMGFNFSKDLRNHIINAHPF